MEQPIVLILAGGSGTRLWPLSRKEKPKQLLSLYSNKTLIEETFRRAQLLSDPKSIYVATTSKLAKNIRPLLPLQRQNFIIEPQAKNTAPILAYFMQLMQQKKTTKGRTVVVLSADHYIQDNETWQKTLLRALSQKEYLVCIGIKPTRAETGYGYIEVDKRKALGESLYKIESFKEKPDLKKAQFYLKSGNFLWNSGMFVFPPALFLDELKKHAPQIYELSEMALQSTAKLKDAFNQMPEISIDYALLEKSSRLAVVPGDFVWDDVGSFEALARILKANDDGNYVYEQTTCRSVFARENIVLASRKKVALLGVQDLVIVEGGDVLLVAHRKSLEQIKKLRELFPESQ
ncbi:MAG: sugar phosphate nucleotidyltransferase [Leptospiraceae bacterium]|nr:sugar phosphate nucleotidyltransferase [Leptospiraceae bacterium]MDW8305856.1 sugar phosphate nucleotidyltransferase [Leptospiraceae bacterium]